MQSSQNKLLSDSGKISKLIEIYFYSKSENYKQDADIDIAMLKSSDEQFQKNQEYVKKKSAYYKKLRIKSGGVIIWDNINIKINDIKIDGDNAIVKVNEDYKYVLDNYHHGISSTGFNYTIGLVKQDNSWFITTIESDDEFDRAYLNTDFDLDSMVEEDVSEIPELEGDSPVILSSNTEQPAQEDDNAVIAASLVRIPYNRSDAATYAGWYSYKTSDPYSNTPYNSYFHDYADLKSDCQNFGSQCVWYGLGGADTYEAIEGKYIPMIDSGSRVWYQTSGHDELYSWVNVSGFTSYASAGGSTQLGPYGSIYSGISNADIGDIIQIKDSSGWYHTYVVNDVSGTAGSRTKSDIWVCAHTGNRYNNRFDTVTSTALSNLRTVKINGAYKPLE
ncbi:MAG: amidase domain-containing protein [Caulobacteraceae bacterium]